MGEAKKTGVKSQSPRRIGFGAIFFIPNDRASDGGELNADLVTAARFQGEFDEG
jgi:hypothetical protein